MNRINHNIIRQLFVLFLIILTGWILLKELFPFLSGILGAITLYVLMKKPMEALVRRNWNSTFSALLLIIISFFAILLPLAGAAIMLSNKLRQAARNSEAVVKAVKERLHSWQDSLGFDLTSRLQSEEISGWLSDNVTSLAGGAFNTFIALSIMYFLLFYMLTNRRRLKETLLEYIPISNENIKIIGEETRKMVRANAIGIPLVAIAQGLVALIGFFLFNIDNPFFWALMVTIGSMIPFVGHMLGTLPVFILTLSNGSPFQAWGVLLYGILITGITDNLIRLYVLNKLDDVHPLVTLIGVIVGIPLFGFIGLIFGPLLVSLFLVIVRIYKKEYGTLKDGFHRIN